MFVRDVAEATIFDFNCPMLHPRYNNCLLSCLLTTTFGYATINILSRPHDTLINARLFANLHLKEPHPVRRILELSSKHYNLSLITTIDRLNACHRVPREPQEETWSSESKRAENIIILSVRLNKNITMML